MSGSEEVLSSVGLGFTRLPVSYFAFLIPAILTYVVMVDVASGNSFDDWDYECLFACAHVRGPATCQARRMNFRKTSIP